MWAGVVEVLAQVSSSERDERDPESWTHGYVCFGSPRLRRHLSAYSAGVRCPRPVW